MKILEWFNQLMKSPELINLLPMQVQPGLPVPIEENGVYQMYVPFYHMWQEDDITMISPALYTACFSFKTLHMISYRNIDACFPEIDKEPLARRKLDPNLIKRKSMNMQYAFELLDDMRFILKNRGYIPQDRIDDYNSVYVDMLLFDEMKSMYKL